MPEESEATMVGEPSEATRRMGSPRGGVEGEVGEDDKGGPVGGGWGDEDNKEGAFDRRTLLACGIDEKIQFLGVGMSSGDS
uniref:Uncharacterized protein n=1 Tax=Oryza meridionalis TaxID=40149 RepID=A0A0E0DPX8_9ORYZ